jgi:hypothetical protein
MAELFQRVGVDPNMLRLQQSFAGNSYFFLYPLMKDLLDRVETLEKVVADLSREPFTGTSTKSGGQP